MGHVLGLVNIGVVNQCHSPCNTNNYNYGWQSGCNKASTEYTALGIGVGTLKVEDGTGACSNWESDNFPRDFDSSELMTSTFEVNMTQPITRVSIAALEEGMSDYVVDYGQADPYPFTQDMLMARRNNNVGINKVHVPDTSFTIADRMGKLPPPILMTQNIFETLP